MGLVNLCTQQVRTKGIQPTTDEIVKYAKFFEDELTLENLSRQQLQAMCRVLDLPPMGMDSFLRFSLRMKLKRLKIDDNVSSSLSLSLSLCLCLSLSLCDDSLSLSRIL